MCYLFHNQKIVRCDVLGVKKLYALFRICCLQHHHAGGGRSARQTTAADALEASKR